MFLGVFISWSYDEATLRQLLSRKKNPKQLFYSGRGEMTDGQIGLDFIVVWKL